MTPAYRLLKEASSPIADGAPSRRALQGFSSPYSDSAVLTQGWVSFVDASRWREVRVIQESRLYSKQRGMLLQLTTSQRSNVPLGRVVCQGKWGIARAVGGVNSVS
ncbi:hypothetical protein BT67DRAFT_134661 [Trichocladium antarcticum]|uniref:Uncharacterized protein n=1 Tax=Trichocladium antarcticum TaxID=1450529 RepID=A0AAN6UG44_9PEZI|nr:hypothetical protein BT67DRAFT_134661 [Trichocladium antarcticum]